MKIYNAVEEIIRKSIADGVPERLSNKGKPLDLSDWKRTPEHLRMSHSILKNAGIAPQEIDLAGQISSLKEEIKSLDKTEDAEERKALIEVLNKSLVTYSIKMDKLRKRR